MYVMKVNKTISLSVPVAEALDGEANQSALVEELLRDHYDLEAGADGN